MMNKFKNQIIKQMKKLTLITKILVVLLVLNFSCSTEEDSLLQEDQNSVKTADNNLLQSKLVVHNERCDYARFLDVIYNFTVIKRDGTVLVLNSAIQEQRKTTFRLEMSQYFTICEVLETTCNDFERWRVPNDEYIDFINNNPIRGQGGALGQIRPTGGSGDYSHCFFL